MQLAFYLQLVFILVAATALACWCGWGLARLALPAALRPYRALLAPLLGFALAMVVGYWFVWTVSGLGPALLALLLATGVLNVLAWLRALGVLAVYVLLRATLGLRRGPALLGTALTSAGALLLWIDYFNFEKQMAAWPLIPLGLLLGVAAVEELARPTTDDRMGTIYRAPTTQAANDASSFV